MPPRMTIPTQLVLRELLDRQDQDTYGRQITVAVGLNSGVVYPILARLEKVGWLASTWEKLDPHVHGRPARKYYRFTADGADAAVAALAGRWPRT